MPSERPTQQSRLALLSAEAALPNQRECATTLEHSVGSCAEGRWGSDGSRYTSRDTRLCERADRSPRGVDFKTRALTHNDGCLVYGEAWPNQLRLGAPTCANLRFRRSHAETFCGTVRCDSKAYGKPRQADVVQWQNISFPSSMRPFSITSLFGRFIRHNRHLA